MSLENRDRLLQLCLLIVFVLLFATETGRGLVWLFIKGLGEAAHG